MTEEMKLAWRAIIRRARIDIAEKRLNMADQKEAQLRRVGGFDTAFTLTAQ